MRLGIIGSNGQLGIDLVECLSDNHEIISWIHDDFDIIGKFETEKIIKKKK